MDDQVERKREEKSDAQTQSGATKGLTCSRLLNRQDETRQEGTTHYTTTPQHRHNTTQQTQS
jgi:hypothetical protein